MHVSHSGFLYYWIGLNRGCDISIISWDACKHMCMYQGVWLVCVPLCICVDKDVPVTMKKCMLVYMWDIGVGGRFVVGVLHSKCAWLA